MRDGDAMFLACVCFGSGLVRSIAFSAAVESRLWLEEFVFSFFGGTMGLRMELGALK